MLGKIFYFLLGIGLGVSMIVYTEPLKRFTGSFAFAESWFGPGGTYTFFKLAGLLLIIFTIFWVTGTVDRLIPNFLLNTGA